MLSLSCIPKDETSITMTAGAVTENGSGIYRYLFYLDNNSANPTSVTTNTTSITTTTGTHVGYCIVVDKAGNQSTAASQSDARTKMWQYGIYTGSGNGIWVINEDLKMGRERR